MRTRTAGPGQRTAARRPPCGSANSRGRAQASRTPPPASSRGAASIALCGPGESGAHSRRRRVRLAATNVPTRGGKRADSRPDRRKGDLATRVPVRPRAPPPIVGRVAPDADTFDARHLRRQPARATAPQGRPGTRLRLPVPLPHRRHRGRHPGRSRRAGSRPGHRARGPHRRPAGAHPPPGRADLRHAARPHRGHPALRRHRRRRRRGAPRLRRARPRRLGRRRRAP